MPASARANYIDEIITQRSAVHGVTDKPRAHGPLSPLSHLAVPPRDLHGLPGSGEASPTLSARDPRVKRGSSLQQHETEVAEVRANAFTAVCTSSLHKSGAPPWIVKCVIA